MTEQQRIERARLAKQALDEFLTPAFEIVEQDYGEKMIAAAASTDPRAPEVISRLANGIKAARQAKAMIEALVADGEVAAADKARAEKNAELAERSPARSRLLGIAPH